MFVFREGSHAAHGPFPTEAEARAYAEEQAQLHPGQAIWLLSPTANVMVAAAEPIWDECIPLSNVRPLATGYAELLRTQAAEVKPPKQSKSPSFLAGFLQRLGK